MLAVHVVSFSRFQCGKFAAIHLWQRLCPERGEREKEDASLIGFEGYGDEADA